MFRFRKNISRWEGDESAVHPSDRCARDSGFKTSGNARSRESGAGLSEEVTRSLWLSWPPTVAGHVLLAIDITQ
jgi:hypothetical protein